MVARVSLHPQRPTVLAMAVLVLGSVDRSVVRWVGMRPIVRRLGPPAAGELGCVVVNATFATVDLAARIEWAEARLSLAVGRAALCAKPESDAFVEEFGGGVAV